jgi:hypothetical protein
MTRPCEIGRGSGVPVTIGSWVNDVGVMAAILARGSPGVITPIR